MNDEVLLDATAIGAKLGMTKHSIYRMAASGAIPAYKAGAKLSGRRFSLAEVKEALRIKRVEPAVGETE
jgi:excisionase family DNA binding protein